MKNVPVPVYCRPLVEKDPTMKVSPGVTGKWMRQREVPPGSWAQQGLGRQGRLCHTFAEPSRPCSLSCGVLRVST